MGSVKGLRIRLVLALTGVGVAMLTAGCQRQDASSATAAAPDLVVFAAASTIDAIGDLATLFGQQHGQRVTCNFAASSMLARQVEAGAACDLFLCADESWMDYLEKRLLLKAGSRCDLLGNRLVFVAPLGRSLRIDTRPDYAIAQAFGGRLALGDPDHVPAGRYARQALEQLGWWNELEERLAPAMDVRAALRLVEAGETELGIVYATDAAASDKVTVVAEIPETLHTPVRYPMALCRTARPAAETFAAFLQGPTAAERFRKLGFVPLATQPAADGT